MKLTEKQIEERFKDCEMEHVKKFSYYNHNIYVAKHNDNNGYSLLFLESDDDNTTVWYVMEDNNKFAYPIGYSYTSEGDIFHACEEPY